jgi:N-acetylglutamate synthase-like GNAT family acetyltransferase
MTLTRRATSDDIPALVRLINAAYVVEQFFIHGDRTSATEIGAKLAMPAAFFLVIDDGDPGQLIGAVYLHHQLDRAHLGMLSVRPDRQGEGHGRALVGAAEAESRALGCTALDLDVVDLRHELPAFYGALGFVPLDTLPFPEPEKLRRDAHLIRMTKVLAAEPDASNTHRTPETSSR